MGLHPTDLHRSLLVFRTTGVWRCSRLQSFTLPAGVGAASGCNLSLLLRGLALLPAAIFQHSGGVWRSSRLQSFAPSAGLDAASGGAFSHCRAYEQMLPTPSLNIIKVLKRFFLYSFLAFHRDLYYLCAVVVKFHTRMEIFLSTYGNSSLHVWKYFHPRKEFNKYGTSGKELPKKKKRRS